tara:strand:- start:1159 stop:1440 length:282 start_codon:yes stop_codon:yes gene_type:complete
MHLPISDIDIVKVRGIVCVDHVDRIVKAGARYGLEVQINHVDLETPGPPLAEITMMEALPSKDEDVLVEDWVEYSELIERAYNFIGKEIIDIK